MDTKRATISLLSWPEMRERVTRSNVACHLLHCSFLWQIFTRSVSPSRYCSNRRTLCPVAPLVAERTICHEFSALRWLQRSGFKGRLSRVAAKWRRNYSAPG